MNDAPKILEENTLNQKQAKVIAGVFFFSGMAAILYQLTWQRQLAVIFGSNSESIAVIIAAFMGGLGLGSLAGGSISKKGFNVLNVFAIVELVSGLFGIISLPLLHFIGVRTAGVSIIYGGLISFAFVLIPTMLMGSTLPLLTAYFVSKKSTVGDAVGELYQMNTLGSAVACVLAALVLFPFLGLSGSVYLAVLINFVVAGISFFSFRTVDE